MPVSTHNHSPFEIQPLTCSQTIIETEYLTMDHRFTVHPILFCFCSITKQVPVYCLHTFSGLSGGYSSARQDLGWGCIHHQHDRYYGDNCWEASISCDVGMTKHLFPQVVSEPPFSMSPPVWVLCVATPVGWLAQGSSSTKVQKQKLPSVLEA